MLDKYNVGVEALAGGVGAH